VTQQRADEQQWRSQINCYYLVKHRRVGRFQITPRAYSRVIDQDINSTEDLNGATCKFFWK
jgi:hypothetical protein